MRTSFFLTRTPAVSMLILEVFPIVAAPETSAFSCARDRARYAPHYRDADPVVIPASRRRRDPHQALGSRGAPGFRRVADTWRGGHDLPVRS
jgi:hypothetical protein